MYASDFIIAGTALVEAGRNFCVTGAPGIGKTDLGHEIARRADADLILSHPAVEDPTVPAGLPMASPGDTVARFLPFGTLAKALEATKRTLWFLDDFGQATPAVQAAYMQLLLARRLNEHVLPDCVSFMLATNRRQDRANVSGILETVKSRCVSIFELEANVDDWCSWAIRSGFVPPVLIAHIRMMPDRLSAFQPSADLTNSPSPRTWSHLAQIFNLTLPKHIKAELYAGAVGSADANMFLATCEMADNMPNVDAILLDPDSATLPDRSDLRYITVTALASRVAPSTFGRIARYAERLEAAGTGEFAALLIRDCVRRDPSVMTQCSADFQRLICGPLGDLIHG